VYTAPGNTYNSVRFGIPAGGPDSLKVTVSGGVPPF
jgi:hypothetical protein